MEQHLHTSTFDQHRHSSTIQQHLYIWTAHGIPLVPAAPPCSADPSCPPAYTSLPDIHSGKIAASPSHALLPDPNAFIAGSLHWAIPFWRRVLHLHPNKRTMLRWLQQGVRLTDFALAEPISGTFSHFTYSSATTPPPATFSNRIPPEWMSWVDSSLNDYLATKAIRRSSTRPHNLSPLTIETGKPRLCFDGRFINLFAKHMPFSMPSVGLITQLCPLGSPQATFDHKSAYHHIAIHPNEQTYFGFEWRGVYFVFNVLPFG